VGDFSNNKIRKITPEGIVTTIGGNLSYASPLGTGVDQNGNVFVADRNNGRVVKISSSGQAVPVASVSEPYGLCVSIAGNIYVGNSEGIHKISPTGCAGKYSIKLYATGFFFLLGIAVDADENIYACDSTSNQIKKVLIDGTTVILAGSVAGTGYVSGHRDGPGDTALFKQPWGVAVDKYGCIYVAGWHNQCVRKIMPSDKLAADWPASHTELSKRCQEAIECLLNVINMSTPIPRELTVLVVHKLILIWLFFYF